MLRATEPALWTGRRDPEDGPRALRWHDVVRCVAPGDRAALDNAPAGSLVLIGFACDAGVVRNRGRPGAADGPDALRRALANTAWHRGLGGGSDLSVLDVGTVACAGDALEDAQAQLAELVAAVAARELVPLVLGGGHEVAWGTWQGLARAAPQAPVAVVNLDAHLDLREPVAGRGTSGTPFRQIADDCHARGWPFRYTCLGAAQTSNTAALFERASALGARVCLDTAMATGAQAALAAARASIGDAPRVQLSICLDVLPAAVAPGVSAPAALGVPFAHVLEVIAALAADERVAAIEIAELNPRHDIDGRTARVAARCCHAVALARP